MRHFILAGLVFLAMGAAAPAYADEAARLELARRVIATRSEEVEMQFFDAMLPYYVSAVQQSLTITDTERERLPQILREEYRAALVMAREHTAQLYARIFSEEDLRALVAFWESSLGRRYIANESEIQQDNIALQQAMNAAVLQNSMDRMLEERNAQHF